MAWHFQTTPVFLEPPVTQALDVRCGYDKSSCARTKPSKTPAEQGDRVGHVFDHMIQGDHVETSGVGNVSNRAHENLQSLAPAPSGRSGVGVDAAHVPAQAPHPLHKLRVAASHVEQRSGGGCGHAHYIE